MQSDIQLNKKMASAFIAIFYLRAMAFCILILLNAITSGQTQSFKIQRSKYLATHWGLEEGLSQAETYDMLKDRNGFLWITTKYGLNRFDGNNFRIYNHDPDESNSIAGDVSIFGIVEDSSGKIWVGTENGLSRYDHLADSFTNFSTEVDTRIQNGDPTSPFWATKNEIFCIEFGRMIIAYNIHTLKKRNVINLDPFNTIALGPSLHYSIFDEANQEFWLLYSESNGNEGGLLNVSLKNHQKIVYKHPCLKKIKRHRHTAEAMCHDIPLRKIWINSNDGLLEFSLQSKLFKRIDAIDNLPDIVGYDDINERWVGIDQDQSGNIWMASVRKGLISYDPHSGIASQVFPFDSLLQKNTSNYNAVVYCDRDGTTWSGFWSRNGFFQISPFSGNVFRYSAKSEGSPFYGIWISNFIKGSYNIMWVGTSDGLFEYSTREDQYKFYNSNNIRGLTGKEIIPVLYDSLTNKLWVSNGMPNGYHSLLEVNLKTLIATPVRFLDQKGQKIEVHHFFPHKLYRNTILVHGFTNDQSKVFQLDKINSACKEILQISFEEKIAAGEFQDDLLFIKNEKTSGRSTYAEINGEWTKIKTPIDSIRWSQVIYDNINEAYWVTTMKKLFLFGKDFRLLKVYTESNGLPEYIIMGLMPDQKGNIWFHTDRTLHHLNITTGKIIMLTEKDGFKKQDFTNNWGKNINDNGNLFFPGGLFGDGFDRIVPENFLSTPSSLYIQAIRVNEKKVTAIKNEGNESTISTKQNERGITIETVNIDYYSKGKGFIRYKMEGQDNDWNISPAGQLLRYENLKPGKYKLLLQPANAGMDFNSEVKVLNINVIPAFWNTSWFITLLLLSVLVILFWIINRVISKQYKVKLANNQRDTQLSELKQKTMELEMQALRAQMNPHFIFNSLNSINRFILQNNRTLASEFLTKFSRLVRLILQNSKAPLITLDSEIESLKLYLELESLRFDYRFDYKISFSAEVDMYIVKVPPLIIQPYAENAIWHGLMPKEEKGNLDIDISQDERFVYIKITDDGVGRKKSSLFSSRLSGTHKSMGLLITAARIGMLHSSGDKDAVSINDLVDIEGNAAGTEVIIKLPVIYD
jgi:ligand-binding sensor domain-containing protein